MAHATWYPTGGDWTYIESVCNLYEAKGHCIIPFAMHHEKNLYTPYNKYFLSNIDYKSLNERKSISNMVKVLGRSIYSNEAVKNLQILLSENKIDIAQLHNIHNIHTPSIIPVLKKNKIPVVWRVLDYKLICPNRTFLSNDQICEACFKHKYYNCITNKCKKNSYLASTVASVESYAYYLLKYYNQVDSFLFQSESTRNMFLKYGFDPGKCEIIENPYDSQLASPNFEGKNYILYFGRVSSEKGIFTLLDAMNLIPNIELKVIGDGPELEGSKQYALDNKISNVSFLGSCWGKELELVLKDCDFVVLPSEWYEPNPYVILQSFSFGKPVVASNIGGLPDMITDGVNGLLVEIKNAIELSNKISGLFKNKLQIFEMGTNARNILERKYNPEIYYDKTLTLFNKLLIQYHI